MLDSQDRVYTLCLRMTGNREDALDLAQETFLNAWRGLPSFQGNSSFSTWVYRLASNACIDFLRRRKRRQQAESPPPWTSGEDPPAEPADPRGSPEDELERRELRRAVERGLQALPEHHRQVLLMRELSGLSYQEIGATGPGPGDGEVPHRPGPAGPEKIFGPGGELFGPATPSKQIERAGEGGERRYADTAIEALERMSQALDAPLPLEERQALEEHLESCPECRAAYAALFQMEGALRESWARPPLPRSCPPG